MVRYDLPALIFIVTGALTIVCNSNYEVITYSKEQIYRLLFSPLNLTIYSVLCMLYFACKFMDYRFSLKLAQFDREADAALVIADYDNESQ